MQELAEALDSLDRAYVVGDVTLAEYNDRRDSIVDWFEACEYNAGNAAAVSTDGR
jgi:hypothetical protein